MLVWWILLFGGCGAFLPYQNPPWTPTYKMQKSTLVMAINGSGWSNPEIYSKFGITSYDWSNNKAQWARQNPMNCEHDLVIQAEAEKEVNPEAIVFVYRNLVKALPWYASVREKLDDPAYSNWFLRFDPSKAPYHVPACTSPPTPAQCSVFYHDQEQTPEVANKSNPHPDGVCDKQCYCGRNPCGEYLFDHRNASLSKWLVEEYILGDTGLGNAAIDGFFIDDYWCSHIINGSGACHDPVQGPSEINKYSQVYIGDGATSPTFVCFQK